MDNKSIEVISTGPPNDCLKVLLNFNDLNEKTKHFHSIDMKTKQLLWDAIFSRLKSDDSSINILQNCLNALRILSREKVPLEEAMTDDRISILLRISDLNRNVLNEKSIQDQPMMIEGLKVIFNMVFQSPTLQIMYISNGILDHLIARIKDFEEQEVYPLEYQYFVTRILFLITALCQDTAPAKVRNLLNGLEVLDNYLEKVMSCLEKSNDESMISNIICEILKILYNLIANMFPRNRGNESVSIDSEDLDELNRTTELCRTLLLVTRDKSNIKKQEIRRHTVDLLAGLPSPCFEKLVPIARDDEDFQSLYLENNILAVESAVEFLDIKLDEVQRTIPSETLAPPLYALHNMAISSRIIRKYLKQRILPPLLKTDVIELPEVGRTIRNKLCSLLTSPVSHITTLVANLLFVLCKENVGKLVKYAGYGNVAGLLANRGLMLGGSPPKGKYSEDEDSESDTEEYKEIEHMINQIEGRIQQERPDPMEGMTEEQKEFEAMKLINAIDKMERSSGIKPCKIGHDGRPQPIDHVMQLQDALENPMRGLRREGDSDSDSD